MLNKGQKIAVRLGYAIVAAILQAELKKINSTEGGATPPVQDTIAQKVGKQLLEVGKQSVDILTNNNPDDSGEFKELVNQQKQITAKIGLEAVRELAEKDIKDPTVKLVIITLIEQLEKSLEEGGFSEDTLHSMGERLMALSEQANEDPKF
jgi:hypothetical protein